VSAQSAETFPTDDEIKLLMAQTKRALLQYKPLIDQEERQLGTSYADGVATDRRLVDALETAVKALESKPQGFNGPAGFTFFEWLDDADRNALLCSSGALKEAAVQMMTGNTGKADALVHLAQSCTDVSTLLYTVSENASALYQRYAEAELQLGIEGAQVAQQCVDILKKKNSAPQK
jgi:hypothetical protein